MTAKKSDEAQSATAPTATESNAQGMANTEAPTQTQLVNQQVAKDPNSEVIEFDFGFQKGENKILQVTICKPRARALRGLSLVNLLNMDVDSIAKVASRVTFPTMSEHDVFELDPSDLTKLGVGIVGFFVNTKEDSLSA